ncbi:MAG TPA: TonB-dependent receptor [Rhizomicrobium sp.]|nr:TonB-dependent receptor [Rhizomicrobium sp.]
MAGAAVCVAGFGARAQNIADLRQMSIEQLQNVDVSTVTKSAEPLSETPASAYVITHDEIVRSGARTIPEILRLAPNLLVVQISASRYVITARGLSGNLADQNFTNKLLVMIDGRSVYTPLFSGVYWDMQDLLPDDIDHIEVVSGPGATLWGANAVNGVINIVTRGARQTQGGLVQATAGNLDQSLGLQYGGTLGNDAAYRVYFRDYFGADTETAGGASAHDYWSKPQGGARIDWTPGEFDTLTLQGDLFSGAEAQPGAPDEDISGYNLLGRWNHAFADGDLLQVQTYADRNTRLTRDGGGSFWVDTYDLDVQHSFELGDWNQVVWGGGDRLSAYRIHGSTTGLDFVPSARHLELANVFMQDSISLSDELTAIVGLKLEKDPFSSWTPLPSVRLSWKPRDGMLFWAAASRAIRSATPFEKDVRESSGTLLVLEGGQNFASEKLDAYELGTRMQPLDDLSFSVSAFYNTYDDLRSIEITPVTTLPFYWGNGIAGHSYGFEAWSDYQMLPWWRWTVSLTELTEKFHFKPGSPGLLGVAQLGDDPRFTASLRAAVNPVADVSLAADLRYVDALPDPHLPSYVELDASITWSLTDDMSLSLTGDNLLHPRHLEFPASEADAVPRSVSAGILWHL